MVVSGGFSSALAAGDQREFLEEFCVAPKASGCPPACSGTGRRVGVEAKFVACAAGFSGADSEIVELAMSILVVLSNGGVGWDILTPEAFLVSLVEVILRGKILDQIYCSPFSFALLSPSASCQILARLKASQHSDHSWAFPVRVSC
jgi:hypothetical protein